MIKPLYIKKLEKSEDIFSKMDLGEVKMSGETFDETNYESVYMVSAYSDGKNMWSEKILKTKHGFYLCITRNILYKTIIDIKVYYNIAQLNELMIFTKQFLKNLKNR
jgi:hypothetical protein